MCLGDQWTRVRLRIIDTEKPQMSVPYGTALKKKDIKKRLTQIYTIPRKRREKSVFIDVGLHHRASLNADA